MYTSESFSCTFFTGYMNANKDNPNFKRTLSVLNATGIHNSLDDAPFIDRPFLKLVEHLATNKIMFSGFNFNGYQLLEFFTSRGRVLIDDLHSCQVMDVTSVMKVPSRISYRCLGNLSHRFNIIYNRWTEMGWFVKTTRLGNELYNLRLNLASVKMEAPSGSH